MTTALMPEPTQTLAGSVELLHAARFSPAQRNVARLNTELTKRGPDGHFVGGIVHEVVRDRRGKVVGNVVHIANPYQGAPLDVVTLPTRCTADEVERIRSRIIPMRESYELLVAIAQAYEHRHPILIEGDTSLGKTFIVNRFMELLYGRGARPVDFYCSGQTDVSELLGKWAPKSAGLSEREQGVLKEFLDSAYGKQKLAAIEEVTSAAADLSPELQQAMLRDKLSAVLKEIGVSSAVQWEFSYGAVPKAMMGSVQPGGKLTIPAGGGAGTILKVDEVGLAEPAVVMALLRIRGEAGRLTDRIQLWEAGGEEIISGDDFFVIYTTNPSDKDYLERKEIDPALARSVVWVRKGSLSDESLTLAAQKYMTFAIGNGSHRKPLRCVIDLQQECAVGIEIAEIAATVHRRYLEIMKKGEAGRRQKLPGSLDHIARLANYMQGSQVIDAATGRVDFAETLRRGVRCTYTAGLIDETATDNLLRELDMLLTDSALGMKSFRGGNMLRSEILALLSEEAHARMSSGGSSTVALAADEREIVGDVTDSILAQLGAKEVSLKGSVVGQIQGALDLFSGESVRAAFLDELCSTERPAVRDEAEWREFIDQLTLLRAALPMDSRS